MDIEDFLNKVSVGDQILSLKKEAVLEQYEVPAIFGIAELETKSDKAQEKAKSLGVDSIHTSKLFGGVFLLQFVSEMITNWLPDPRGWVQGGSLSAKFTRVVYFNETITCKGQIKDKTVKDNRKCLVCDIWVENAAGDKVVVGEAAISF